VGEEAPLLAVEKAAKAMARVLVYLLFVDDFFSRGRGFKK
jgi:hypothetical protein